MTHRQYLAWSTWLNDQWNTPTKSDNYLMQIACEIRRVLSKKPNKVQMKHFQLKFGIAQRQSEELTPERKAWITASSKSKWVSFMGMPVRRNSIDPHTGSVIDPNGE